MKYSSVIEDVQVDLFIKENIEEIFNSFSTISVNNLMEYAFAHGKAGLAYVLNCYSRIYKDDIYDDAINSFSDFIADVIRKQLLTGFDKLKSLDYSWCEGFSGLILYLPVVLVDVKVYCKIPSFTMEYSTINSNMFSMLS